MFAHTAAAETNTTWLERRLDLWGAWRNGGVMRGLGAAVSRWPSKTEIRSGTVIDVDNPAFERLMSDTDRAVASLEPEFKAVIVEEHGRADYTTVVEKRADNCRCSESTYRRRLSRAYELLALEIQR